MASQSLFIFGLGYSTTGIARQAQDRHIGVTSTCRKPDLFAPLESAAHRLVKFDPAAKQLLSDNGLQALKDATYVVSSIPPIAAKLYDPVLQAQLRLLKQVASSSDCQISGLGYLSSTGVYGDWQGDWVDEWSAPRTATGRGMLRLEAEAAWAALADQLQLPLTIFRLGGIYGPRRSVLHNLQTQAAPGRNAARRSQQRYTSRCHVADVAQAVLADMHRRTASAKQQLQQSALREKLPWPGLNVSTRLVDVVNVVDDEPAPRGDVEDYALQLLHQAANHAGSQATSSNINHAVDSSGNTSGSSVAGIAHEEVDKPRRVAQERDSNRESTAARQRGSSMKRGVSSEEKRVRNAKLKHVLGVQLLAATYREGLSMMHGGNTAPFTTADLDCLFSQQ